MFHDAVGIGADHGQLAAEPEAGALAVHFGRIVIGIEIGDHNHFSLVGIGAPHVEPFVKGVVLGGRADMVDGLAAIFGDHRAGGIA
ncbi:hypothetical protein D3C72_1925420 [compost metagenome]